MSTDRLEDAAGSIESIDLQEGLYLGAFSDRGEVIEMGPGDLFATFTAHWPVGPRSTRFASVDKQGDRGSSRTAQTTMRWRFFSKAAPATEQPNRAA